MKPLVLLIMFFSSIHCVDAAVKSNVLQEAIRAKQENTIERAIRGAIRLLPDYLLDKEAIAKEMLENKKKHRNKKDSKNMITAQQNRILNNSIKNQMSKFAVSQKSIPDNFINMTIERNKQSIANDIIILTSPGSRYDKYYEDARNYAVSEQRNKIKIKYPTVIQIEEIYAASDVQKQSKILAGSIAKSIVDSDNLFEENESNLVEHLQVVMEHGIIKLKNQLNILMTSRGGESVDFDGIKDYLVIQIKNVVKSTLSVNGKVGHIFGKFPKVNTEIKLRAMALEKLKFENYFKNNISNCSFLKDDEVTGLIPASYGKVPSSFNEHKGSMLGALKGRVKKEVITVYTTKIGSKDEKRKQTFASKIIQYANIPQLDIDLTKKLNYCLSNILKNIRAKLALNELSIKNSSIADGTFELRDSTVTRWGPGNDKILLLGEFPESKKLYLEETKRLFDKKKDEIINEAKRALRTQNDWVDKLKYDFIKKINGNQSEDQLRKKFVNEVFNEWGVSRRNTLTLMRGNHGNKRYLKLFTYVTDRINDIINREWVNNTNLGGASGMGAGNNIKGTNSAGSAQDRVMCAVSEYCKRLVEKCLTDPTSCGNIKGCL